jgi:ATP-dependent Clp protease, protease subunit
MMHQPSAGIGGTASDIAIQAQQSLHIKKVLNDLIAEHTGQTVEQVVDRRRPRPLVHRRAGAGVRPGRQGGHQCPRPPTRAARPGTEGLTDMNYYIPQWEERTSYGFRRIDPYAKLFEERIIYLGTPISDDVANAVIAQLMCLETMNPDSDISIYINSPGGSFTALTAIYDTMNFIKPDVQTVCMGQAASAAAILLGAGAKGKRMALPNSRILIHQPYTEGTFGQTSDIEIQANEILRMRELLERMIADSSGKDIEQVRKDIERDKILTAQEAKEYGIVDEVVQSRKLNALMA